VYVRSGASVTELRKADARRAVGSHLNVKWADQAVPALQETYPSERAGLDASFGEMTNFSVGLPSLVFVYSDEMRPAPSRDKHYIPKPTQQAVDSAAAWADLFQTEGDYSVFIPGRFFNVIRVDATDVGSAYNKYLFSQKAPMVILTDKEGKIADIFQGKAAIKRAKVVESMAVILRKDGYIQSGALFAKLGLLMNQLEKAEYDVLSTRVQLEEAAAKLAKAQASKAAIKKGALTSSGETARRLADKCEADLERQQKVKYEILKQEYALLRDLGLPDAKMPSEPAENKSTAVAPSG
jgi:hypothetical protein